MSDKGAFNPGIGGQKGLDAFTEKMAGKGRGGAVPKAKRASKAAAPNPPTPNANTVVGKETSVPAPAKSRSKSGGINVVVNIGKEYC